MTTFNPLVYFQSIWQPTKMFRQRRVLSWGSMVLVFIFLISCLMFPITLKMAQFKTVSLDKFVPNIASYITDDVAGNLSQAKIEKDSIHGNAFQYKAIAGWLNNQDTFLHNVNEGVYFSTEGYFIKLPTGKITKIPYSQPNLSHIKDKKGVVAFLSQQWFVANRAFVIGYMLLTTFVIIATNTLLITLGSALFLYFTRRTKLFTLKSYKECLNFILNAMGLPTIFAVFALFGNVDIPVALQLYGFATVLVIAWVFYITRFNDTYNNRRLKK